MKIGVLSLQGDYLNHINTLKELDISYCKVRYSSDFDCIDGLIIPGGESTAIYNLIEKENLYDKILEFVNTKPVYGTCAGLILLSKVILNNNYTKNIKSFNALDIEIERNGWGRQINSFIEEVKIKPFNEKFRAIFIRAPKIKSVNKDVEILSEFKGTPIMVRKDNILGTTFHPELTNDIRIHNYFSNIVENHKVLC